MGSGKGGTMQNILDVLKAGEEKSVFERYNVVILFLILLKEIKPFSKPCLYIRLKLYKENEKRNKKKTILKII